MCTGLLDVMSKVEISMVQRTKSGKTVTSIVQSKEKYEQDIKKDVMLKHGNAQDIQTPPQRFATRDLLTETATDITQ